MGDDMDPTNPYDPPERQALEEHLYRDQQLQDADHQGVQAERHIIDAATAAGEQHTHDDERLQAIEQNEQRDAAHVVRDQQDIDSWDQAHPGWQDHLDQYQPAAPADPSTDTQDAGNLYASADTQYPEDLSSSADMQPADAYDGGDASQDSFA